MKNKIAISLIVFLSGMFSISAQNIIFKNAVDILYFGCQKKNMKSLVCLCVLLKTM